METKEKSGIKVGDIMTRNFVSINPDINLIECAREMTKKRVGSLILKEGQKLTGLLTEKDILWALTKADDLKKIKASDIASRKVATIKPSADLYEALGRMKKLKFRRLPVVVNGNLIGMLTLKDILRMEPGLFTDISFAENMKEESGKRNKLNVEKRGGEGMCEECGNIDSLYKIDGRMLCNACRDDM